MPTTDPRIWMAIRAIATGLMLGFFLWKNYESGFVLEKDLPTIVGVLLTIAGVDASQLAGLRKDK
jgi:hypothetical protein